MKNEKLNEAWAARKKLRAEGTKLIAEGDKLRAEGNKLWDEAVLEVHGNINYEWRFNAKSNIYDCVLETGEIFSG